MNAKPLLLLSLACLSAQSRAQVISHEKEPLLGSGLAEQPRLDVRVLAENSGTHYRLDVIDKTPAEILDKLAEVLDIRMVYTGDLPKVRVSKLSVDATSVEELLVQVTRSAQISMTPLADGTYLFGQNLKDLVPTDAVSSPQLQAGQSPRLDLHLRNKKDGVYTRYDLDVAEKSLKEVLGMLSQALKVSVIIDQDVKGLRVSKLNLSASSANELLFKVAACTSINVMVDSRGLYHFMKSSTGLSPESSKAVPSNPPSIDPDFLIPRWPADKKAEPDNHWGKIPFNGREFYIVPLPVAPLASTSK